MKRAGQKAWVIAAGGMVLFWATMYVLVTSADLALVDAILLSTLLVGVPMLSMAQLPLIEGQQIERLPAYWSSIVTLWLLGSACWFVGARDGGAAALGLVSIGMFPFFAWSVGLTAAGMGIIVVFRAVGRRFGVVESALLRDLLPQTRREQGVFTVLSFAAGTGEELAYRGYSIPMLLPLIGTGWAVAITTAVFGLMHGYQGWVGIIRTALMGGVLAGGFLAAGSLWPPIAAHVAIDLLAGIVFGERLLSHPGDDGV